MWYDFVQGEFGPFNPSMHSQVPLWLAVHLKQRQKCRIEPPEWLNVGENECHVWSKVVNMPHYV